MTADGLQTMRTEDELKAFIADRPSDFRPYVELARLYQKANRIDDAERVLRDALTYSPRSAGVFSALVSLATMAATPDPQKALAVAEEWMQVDPSSPLALLSAVNVHGVFASQLRDRPSDALSHLDQGLRLLDEAAQLRPDDPTAARARGILLGSKAALTTDPAERDALFKQADEIMARLGGQGGAAGGSSQAFAWSSEAGGRGGPPTPPSPTGAVRVGSGIRTPTRIRDVKPIYPREARKAKVEGVVMLELNINAAGKVTDARVVRSIPQLDQAAIDAVRQWEYTIAEIDGVPVPVIMVVSVQFKLP